ncbi:WD40/YVTN/BNR-like repeat-containing protein [Micromonospora sp. I033]
MSDREFTGFDVETVAEVVRQPPLDDLRAAARSRRRQRSAFLAAAVVVAMAGMAAVPLAARPSGTGWAGPDQPPPRPARAGEFVSTGPDSGVAVARLDCAVLFAHSDDGGRNWSDWNEARYQAASCQTDSAGNRDADLEYAVLGEGVYLVREAEGMHLSTDHGRTWRDAERAMVPVAAFPAKARPVFCQQGCGAVREPLAVDGSTVYRLAGNPPSPYPPFSIYPAADGTVWVTYWPGEIDRPMVVARSADRGATWTTWRPEARTNVVAAVGVDDREGYLLIEPAPPAGSTVPVGPARLLRTGDGGRTWTDTGTDLPATQQLPNITVGSDGSLLVPMWGTDAPELSAKLLVSRDGGRHFTVAREYRSLEGTAGAGPGKVWLYGRDDRSDAGPDHVIVSADGAQWTRFALPH